MSASLMESFESALCSIPMHRRQYFGSHHFELIKETCLQLKKLCTCLLQQNVLEKVMRLMVFARAFGEHGPESTPFATPREKYLDVAGGHDSDSACGCLNHESLPARIQEWTAERTRLFMEELELTCHLLEEGMDEGLFSCHLEMHLLFRQCKAVATDYYLMLCGLTGREAELKADPNRSFTLRGCFAAD